MSIQSQGTTNHVESDKVNLTDMAKSLSAQVLGAIFGMVGIDVTNADKANMQLNNIKQIVTDERLIDITAKLAKDYSKYVKAAEPLVEPLVKQVNEIVSTTLQKMGDTAILIASNALKEIPGPGLIYSILQDGQKIGEAWMSTAAAVSEIVEKGSESVLDYKNNLEMLQQVGGVGKNNKKASYIQIGGDSIKKLSSLKREKNEIEKRINDSMSQFNNPVNYYKKLTGKNNNKKNKNSKSKKRK